MFVQQLQRVNQQPSQISSSFLLGHRSKALPWTVQTPTLDRFESQLTVAPLPKSRFGTQPNPSEFDFLKGNALNEDRSPLQRVADATAAVRVFVQSSTPRPYKDLEPVLPMAAFWSPLAIREGMYAKAMEPVTPQTVPQKLEAMGTSITLGQTGISLFPIPSLSREVFYMMADQIAAVQIAKPLLDKKATGIASGEAVQYLNTVLPLHQLVLHHDGESDKVDGRGREAYETRGRLTHQFLRSLHSADLDIDAVMALSLMKGVLEKSQFAKEGIQPIGVYTDTLKAANQLLGLKENDGIRVDEPTNPRRRHKK